MLPTQTHKHKSSYTKGRAGKYDFSEMFQNYELHNASHTSVLNSVKYHISNVIDIYKMCIVHACVMFLGAQVHTHTHTERMQRCFVLCLKTRAAICMSTATIINTDRTNKTMSGAVLCVCDIVLSLSARAQTYIPHVHMIFTMPEIHQLQYSTAVLTMLLQCIRQ